VDDQVSGDGTRGWQFERFVMDLLKRMPDVRLLVQVKLQTPQTLQRSRDIIDQLKGCRGSVSKISSGRAGARSPCRLPGGAVAA
jgi:hypothetical protein